MTGISVAICRISRNCISGNQICNIFKHQYLRNKRFSTTPLSGSEILFIAYLECASNLEHFEKKDEHPSLVISEIIDSERVGYLNV